MSESVRKLFAAIRRAFHSVLRSSSLGLESSHVACAVNRRRHQRVGPLRASGRSTSRRILVSRLVSSRTLWEQMIGSSSVLISSAAI